MRRPTLRTNTVAAVDAFSTSAIPDKEEGKLSRMKRLLAGSLRGRRSASVKTFGVPLEELSRGPDGVPIIVSRLATFIETYGLHVEGLFRLSGGNPRLVERLKATVDRSGDADLEACGDITSIASLVKLWLRDLPEPLVPAILTAELVTLLHKYGCGPEWCVQADKCLQAGLAQPNLATLVTIVSLLSAYVKRHQLRALGRSGDAASLATVFAPLLFCAEYRGIATPTTINLTLTLIQQCDDVFGESGDRFSGDMRRSCIELQEEQSSDQHLQQPANRQRKRKDRHETSSQSLDRKFVRSNSEERPCVENCENGGSSGEGGGKDSIRRVASHEDFTRHTHARAHHLMELIVEANTQPMPVLKQTQERNTTPSQVARSSGMLCLNLVNNTADCQQDQVRLSLDMTSSEPIAVVLPSTMAPDEAEKRRNSERFAPQHGLRNMARRRKSKSRLRPPQLSGDDIDGGGSSKENEDEKESPNSPSADKDMSASLSRSSSSDSSHSFLNLFTDERGERCPSPIASPGSPRLDLRTQRDTVSTAQPLTSRDNWSFAHRQPPSQCESCHEPPRTSMMISRRMFTKPAAMPSPELELHILEVTKQIQSVKHRLRRYEDGFEYEFGCRPSHADKMANPDTKQMCSTLSRLRKELKHLKDDGGLMLVGKSLSQTDKAGVSVARALKEETIADLEKRLEEKRVSSGRPAGLEEMTRDQLVEEKAAVQRALLQLEDSFGRPDTKHDRDLVRPLYDRYRALKRFLSKLKEGASELSTILEHETMDFKSTSPPPSLPDEGPTLSSSIISCIATAPTPAPTPDSTLENLHALPRLELLEQLRTVREDKKQLRCCLREYEDALQVQMGRKLQREDRLPMEDTYLEYKHAKAKQRLLEALLTKKK